MHSHVEHTPTACAAPATSTADSPDSGCVLPEKPPGDAVPHPLHAFCRGGGRDAFCSASFHGGQSGTRGSAAPRATTA